MSALPALGVQQLAWVAWWTPGVIVGVALVAVVYAWLMWGPIRDQIPEATAPTLLEASLFFLALLMAYAALGSPLGYYAMTSSFLMHMIQHMLAGLVVPPLLLVGVPKWAWRRIVAAPGVGRVFRFLARPVLALVIFNVVFGVMVAPPIITEMVRSMAAMVFWHVLLMITGVFMFWPVMSPIEELPRLHPGLQVLYLFLDGVAMLLPLAIVTLNETSLYNAAYGAAPRFMGLSLMSEQQLGGGICLSVVHVVYLGLGFWRLSDWMKLERKKFPDFKRVSLVDPLPAEVEEARRVARAKTTPEGV